MEVIGPGADRVQIAIHPETDKFRRQPLALIASGQRLASPAEPFQFGAESAEHSRCQVCFRFFFRSRTENGTAGRFISPASLGQEDPEIEEDYCAAAFVADFLQNG
jgi:hypothetical protein